jgi:competence protein ComEA
MKFKHILQDYFTFNRNERRGIIILLVIIFLLAVANKTIFFFEKPARIDAALFDSASHDLGLLNDSLVASQPIRSLFLFNPNSIDSFTLDRLELSESVKHNMLKFRSKGGVFRSKEDFRKIFGVTDLIYRDIEPYIVFENETKKELKNAEKRELFIFDPNRATDNEFLRLGLSEKQIATIRNYQKKGGRFKAKEDFFRIYGLRDKQKELLADYMIFEPAETNQSPKIYLSARIDTDINNADSVQLKQLPGIGDKLSKRIVKYRELLGGFYAVSQLKEVYGIQEQMVIQLQDQLTVDQSKIRKLDLNFASFNDLSRHPYLQKKLARQIVNFRTKYGSIKSLTVLRDSMILSMDDYNRLKPYF